MPTYRRIHEKIKRAPILRSYDYVQLNQLQTTARSHHTLLQTHAITHTKIFFFNLYVRVSDSSQPVTYVRKYCTDKTCHKPYRYQKDPYANIQF